jgi:hypothetical protein
MPIEVRPAPRTSEVILVFDKNALAPILSTLSGILRVVDNDVHPLNALIPIEVKPIPRESEVILVLMNAADPIITTLLGILKVEAKEVQPLNAPPPIEVSPAPRTREVNLVFDKNAFVSMLRMLSGIVSVPEIVQLVKAPDDIVVTAVDKDICPLQHADDGEFLLTQPVVMQATTTSCANSTTTDANVIVFQTINQIFISNQ